MAPTTPPPDGPGGPAEPADPATFGRVTGTWSSPDGEVVILSDCSTGVDWLAGREGEDMPPFDVYEDENIDTDGSSIRGVRATPRTVILPLLVHKARYAEFRDIHQRIARAFDPFRGDGTLTLRQPDGVTRQLTARYSSGLEGRDIADPYGKWWRIYPLALRAVDPWWYDTAPRVLTWRASSGQAGFFEGPFFPLKLSGSAVLGAAVANNVGDAPVHGVWTITPPYTGMQLINETTGKAITLNGAEIADGPDLIIDTRPGRQSIRDSTGQNLWGTRVGTPTLWPLVRGVNVIELAVSGTSAATEVRFEYTPRRLTA